MKVIIINGMAQNGKSTFVKLCKDNYKFVKELSIVDKIKEFAEILGWNGQKDEKGRRFLADLKDAVERYDRNIIYDALAVDLFYWEDMSYPHEPVFFINARSPEDIDYLKQKYEAKTLFIVDPRKPKITSNHADAGVNNYVYDYTILNDGDLDKYAQKAKDFMKEIFDED